MGNTANQQSKSEIRKSRLGPLLPWLIGLAAAPLLFGAVKPESQAAVAAAAGCSFLLLATRLSFPSRSLISTWFVPAFCLFLILQMIPLPAAVVRWMAPERFHLAQLFPIEIGQAPHWLTLSLSPARSAQRFWELALIFTCFILARYGFARMRAERAIVTTLTIAVFFLAIDELWSRSTQSNQILGIWSISWGRPTGTFGNRNHFANWIYTATLLIAGWIIRNIYPLRSARLSPLRRDQRHPIEAFLLLATVSFGLVMAVLSGSRGGLLAFAAGGCVWIALLLLRSRSRSRWLAISLGSITLAAVLACAADFLLHRLAQTASSSPAKSLKLDLWSVASNTFLHFPLFGSGLGTFLPASILFKTSHGDIAFWHAENDYLEWLAETGFVGCLLFLYAVVRLIRPTARNIFRRRLREPELFFGALAAIICLAVHSAFDFPLQIPANAMLAACLFGYLAANLSDEPVVPPLPNRGRVLANISIAILLLSLAAFQAASVWQFQAALRSTELSHRLQHLKLSLALWPSPPEREITFARTAARWLLNSPDSLLPRRVADCRQHLGRVIASDPFNWEIRLERAWFDLAFSADSRTAIDEAQQVSRLNPLSPQIALQFARHFATENRRLALHFIQDARLTTETDMDDALDIAWTAHSDPASLWQIVPNTTTALLAIGRFAIVHNLWGMSAEALDQLTNRIAPEQLAGLWIQAKAPERAIQLLSSMPATDRRQLLLAQASLAAGQDLESIRYSESLWAKRSLHLERPAADPLTALPVSELESALRENSTGELAVRIAETIAAAPAEKRNLPLLEKLAQQFPHKLRIRFLLFQTQSDLHQYPAAARTALHLATQIEEQP